MSEPGGPVWLSTVEISSLLGDLVPPSERFVAARVLVRLHGRPLGELHLPLPPGGIAAADLVAIVDAELGAPLAAHLAADGLGTQPVSAADLAPLDAPPCTWQSRLAAVASEPPLVSVVVATCRRAERLLRTLRTLAAQTYPHFEALVVDNCPSEPGAEKAVQALGDPRFRHLVEATPGASRARNLGVRAARGEVVACTDDDVDADPDWLGNLAVPFYEDPGIACVTGLILPASLDSEAEQLFEQFGGFAKGYSARTFSGTDTEHGPLYPYNAGLFGSGASAAFRRDALLAVGGFPVDLGPATTARGGEDLDVYLSLLFAGHRLRYEPAAVVRHEHRIGRKALAHQIHSYGIGLSAMVTKRVLASPAERRAVLRALPAAVRYVLASDSAKNAEKSAAYPKRLTALELAGLAYGPIAYLRSRRAQARGTAG